MAEQETIDFAQYLIDDKEKGIFRADRNVFTDPEIFELEMKYIFEKNWMYLCHESQVKKPRGFFHRTNGPSTRDCHA